VYAGIRGTGPYGDLVGRALGDLRVATASEPDPRGDTGLCVTFLDPSAERSFVTSPGVESRVTLDQLRTCEVHPGDVVAVSGYDLVYEDAADPVLAWLAGLPAGVDVVLDGGPLVGDIRADRWQAATRLVTVLSVNEREASRVGEVPADVLLVVRRGAAGCTVEGGPDRLPRTAVPSIEVDPVDTTGAGDTHTGVLAAGLVEGLPLEQALRRANVAAAISVTRPGPASAPTRAEVDEVLHGR
jgi:sugar/nucleoside kinase (ribokinase family)